MKFVKDVARFGLHRLGGLNAQIWRTRDDFRILTYHRFSPDLDPGVQDALDRQCEFLARHFRVTPLAEIAKAINQGTPLPPRTLAVSIDDGYRDILTTAFPVFEKWRIPATVYLISDFLDGRLWLWWDQLSYAIEHTPKELAATRVGDSTAAFPLKTPEQRNAAASSLIAKLTQVPDVSRRNFVAALSETFEVEIPREAPPEFAALDWSEVRKLADSGLEFGAHTKTHPILSNVGDAAALTEEIAGSKARIEQQLGRAVIHFCYPNGNRDLASEAVVERCGFATAVTTEMGLNSAAANRLGLKRLSVAPGFADYYFRELVAGLH